MRILFVGSKDRGALCLAALVEAGLNVIGVIAPPDNDPNAFWSMSVGDAAVEIGLSCHIMEDINKAPDFVSHFSPDLIVLCGYGKVVGRHILDIPARGTINLHAGKLPDYRGGSPMNWALINGEEQGTCTIHYATEKVDAGPILVEHPFPIFEHDTIEDVRQRTLDIFPDLLVYTIAKLDDLHTKPVDITEGTYWASRKPQDGRIDWQHMTAKQVYDFVRALTHPYPGAFTFLDGEKLYVWKASLLKRTVKHAPGRICMPCGEGRVVMASDRGVCVRDVQFEEGGVRTARALLDSGAYFQ